MYGENIKHKFVKVKGEWVTLTFRWYKRVSTSCTPTHGMHLFVTQINPEILAPIISKPLVTQQRFVTCNDLNKHRITGFDFFVNDL